MKIEVLAKFNQYESKRYFAAKIVEAFMRAGVDARLFDMETDGDLIAKERWDGRDGGFVCSFNRVAKDSNGRYVWETMAKPYISFLVDPVVYNMETVTMDKSLATCVDRDDCLFASCFGKNNVLFMPHAVERELDPGTSDRIYPVVLIGTCYDPDNLKAYWRKHLPSDLKDVVEEAIQNSFALVQKTFVQATLEALQKRGLKPEDVPFQKLLYYVDYYMRGYDRIELVRSIRDTEVHVFGGTAWRAETPISGWNRYFASQKNVIVHPAVPFEDSLEILKKSKICLNSVLSVRNGSHERVLASYACGAMPISSDNLYWREQFGEDIILYPYENRLVVEERIKELLADEPLRRSLVERGREKVMARHTWDNRVDLLLKSFQA